MPLRSGDQTISDVGSSMMEYMLPKVLQMVKSINFSIKKIKGDISILFN